MSDLPDSSPDGAVYILWAIPWTFCLPIRRRRYSPFQADSLTEVRELIINLDPPTQQLLITAHTYVHMLLCSEVYHHRAVRVMYLLCPPPWKSLI